MAACLLKILLVVLSTSCLIDTDTYFTGIN